jgi:hypothetical protein
MTNRNYLNTNIILFFSFFTLCFDNIPKFLQVNFISIGLSNKLSWYPLFILLCVYIYQRLKNRKNISRIWEERATVRYLLLYVGIILISTILGFICYPYYDVIFNGPIGQIEKLPSVMNFFISKGIDISLQTLTQLWLTVRSIKGIILEFLYTFGFSYIVYYYIRENWEDYFQQLQKATQYALYFMIAYSCVELMYLAGNSTATTVLSFFNPVLHPIAVDHDWWPPLLWKGQLRSVFSEPSRIGNFAALALPLLWCNILSKNECTKKIVILTIVFSFMVFMTKARTAVAMFIGLLALLFLILLWLKNKNYLKRFVIILFTAGIGFFCSLGYINSFLVSPQIEMDQKSAVSTYLNDNLLSLASSQERSNGARYALIKSNIKTGMEHPILGVGQGLGTAYVVANFDDVDMQDREVEKWVNDYYKEGPLKYSLDAMNEYVSRFASTGIFGLLIFIIPYMFAIIYLFRKLRSVKGNQQVHMVSIWLALVGTFVSGCNGSLTVLYVPWIVLAFAYSIIYSKQN